MASRKQQPKRRSPRRDARRFDKTIRARGPVEGEDLVDAWHERHPTHVVRLFIGDDKRPIFCLPKVSA